MVDDRCFVVPAVHFFQQERPEELWHPISSWTGILVVGIELHVGKGILTDERLDRVVSAVFEPDSRDGPKILSERGQ